jgi:hypothetical protein
MLFSALLPRALVCAAIARLYADAACHGAEDHRRCVAKGILPLIRESGQPHRSSPGTARWVVEHANAWLLARSVHSRKFTYCSGCAILRPRSSAIAACILVISNQLAD